MNTPRYTALIRTFNSGPLVLEAIRALKAQTAAPDFIVAVDSGSTPEQLAMLTPEVDQLIDISGQPFNFSRAINVGIPACHTSHVLIVSSHVIVADPQAIARAIASAQAAHATGFYLCEVPGLSWEETTIDARSFTGQNGLSNACGFVPVKLVAERPFREEVFSAEDQEWSAWLFQQPDTRLIRVRTQGVHYRNPRVNYTKQLNEELAIAYYVDRQRLGLRHIGTWLLKAVWSCCKGDLERARFRAGTARELFKARTTQPVKQSRYF